jgi:hypothetical protein
MRLRAVTDLPTPKSRDPLTAVPRVRLATIALSAIRKNSLPFTDCPTSRSAAGRFLLLLDETDCSWGTEFHPAAPHVIAGPVVVASLPAVKTTAHAWKFLVPKGVRYEASS